MADPTPFRADAPPAPVALPSPLPRVEIFLAEVEAEAVSTRIDLLSPPERAKASRLALPARRAEFILGRSLLRQAVGARLRLRPSEVPISESPSGKPTLPGSTGLHVSVSHSAGSILAAVSDLPVGIDLERIRPIGTIEEISHRFFSKSESAAIREAPEERRLPLFFEIWTRKEAVAKALGSGLSRFPRFSVLPRPEPPSEWRIGDLRLGSGFAAAVATIACPGES